jgi:hypothetical protein
MTVALKFLGQITNDIFERQMRRAALRINANQHFFGHRAA